MSDVSIAERIRGFIGTNFYVPAGEELSDDLSLIDQGLIDSTGVLEVVDFLERSFGVTVADQEMVPDNFGSIRRIAAFVQRKRAAG